MEKTQGYINIQQCAHGHWCEILRIPIRNDATTEQVETVIQNTADTILNSSGSTQLKSDKKMVIINPLCGPIIIEFIKNR
jgi:hypothetical protein